LFENLVGDRAYDSDQLDEELRREGMQMIAPQKSIHQRKTQDDRRLRHYERRLTVETVLCVDAMASPFTGGLGVQSTSSWRSAEHLTG
jgi:hypothetical protein